MEKKTSSTKKESHAISFQKDKKDGVLNGLGFVEKLCKMDVHLPKNTNLNIDDMWNDYQV